jgi:hypothetical protein
MTQKSITFDQALTEVSASSAGGAPFLIAYGVTFIITGILAYLLPEEPAALIALFQGGVALPAAFLLERRLRWGAMAPDNPLKSLSAQLAVSQGLAIPALIIVYNLNPRAIPVVLAGLGGVHFLPYAWLHRTRLYAVLAVAVAIGSFAIQLILGPPAFQVILLYVGIVYFVLTPLVYRHAARLSRE